MKKVKKFLQVKKYSKTDGSDSITIAEKEVIVTSYTNCSRVAYTSQTLP